MALIPQAVLPGRCFPRWKRRLIASVAVLLALSALLGDTDVGHAAAVPSSAASLDAPLCSPGSNLVSGRGEYVSPGWGQPLAVGTHRAQPGPARLAHALVGVPPWVIWPASPLPRIAGAFLHPPLTRLRVAASMLATRDICATGDSDVALPRRPGSAPGWPEPFYPLDRLAGVDQRFPRPPPHESR
jgi:hypothetical protein